MRRFTLMLAITAAVVAIHADELTADQALARALGNGPSRAMSLGTQPTLAYTHAKDGRAMTYVFDKAEGGYMVLSADDAAAPVLGYSLEGQFDKDNIPENLRYWLDIYAQEIEYARQNDLEFGSSPQVPSSWAPIAPMCTTKWNQSAPYNNLCPSDASGEHAVTGCVATAMAQMLNYHEYPEVGTGSKTNSCGGYTSVTVNFADYPFDWANMKDTYPAGSNAANRQAVAELMLCCGVSVNMQYSTTGSGAYSEDIPKALVNNFKYDKNCHILNRDYYPISQWQEFVYNELATVGPVIYGGVTAGSAGHSFICDGYQGNGYFHFNWGWGGISDGYFLLTALDPSAQGIGGATTAGAGFNYYQDIIVGAKQPVEGSDYYYELRMVDGFNIVETSASLGSKVTATAPYNGSAWMCTGSTGVWITSQNGDKRYVQANEFSVSQYYYCGCQEESGEQMYITIPTDLESGTYTVSPAWCLKNGQPQDVMVEISKRRSMKMVVSGTNVTFSAIEGQADVRVNSVEINNPTVFVGKSVEYTVEFSNPSQFEYYNIICSGLYPAEAASGTKPTYAGNTAFIDVEPGQTTQWQYSSKYSVTTPGQYVLYFYKPSTYEFISEGYPITFEAAPTDAETKIVVSGFEFIDGNTQAVDPENVAVQFNIQCTAGYYDKQLTVGITQGAKKTWIERIDVPEFSLYAGQGKEIQALGATTVLSVGKTYKIALYQGINASASTLLAGPIEFTIYDPTSGIGGVEADEAVHVQHFNLQGQPVDIERAAPGIYLRVSKYADGSSQTEKIVK